MVLPEEGPSNDKDRRRHWRRSPSDWRTAVSKPRIRNVVGDDQMMLRTKATCILYRQRPNLARSSSLNVRQEPSLNLLIRQGQQMPSQDANRITLVNRILGTSETACVERDFVHQIRELTGARAMARKECRKRCCRTSNVT
jgi:hypothetical protein